MAGQAIMASSIWNTTSTSGSSTAKNIFAQQLNHINGIESFWSLAKRRLSKFCGVPKRTFYLHLKETEFRFNHRNNNLYKELLNFLRKDPL